MARRQRKITAPQVKVLLDYLGVPLRDQPAAAATRHELLDAIHKNEPERYELAYKLIVLKLDPYEIIGNPDAQALATHEIAKKVDELFHDGERDSMRRMEAIVDAKSTSFSDEMIKALGRHNDSVDSKLVELEEFAKKRIAEEAKKMNVIGVKVNDKKPKRMEGVMPPEFETVLQLAAERKNIMLVGPAGCGKTFLAGKVAEAFDMRFSSQSCTEGMSESLLTGWLLPVGDSAQFKYVQSEFVDIYENGGVFLLDEIDAADPNVLVFINQAIANGQFTLPQRYEKPLVKRHPDAVIMAAANTFGNGADMVYVGRNQLDAATLDRFRVGMVAMDYSVDVEQSLINPDVLEWGWEVRKRIVANNLQRIMSTRLMIDASDMYTKQDWTMGRIAKSYFADWSPEEKAVIGPIANMEA